MAITHMYSLPVESAALLLAFPSSFAPHEVPALLDTAPPPSAPHCLV